MRLIKMLLWVCLPAFLATGCAVEKEPRVVLQDQPVQDFQPELLDEAFAIATAIPLEPHIKDRARCQEKAVVAALNLGQPTRALHYAGQIPNWRRGKCLADYAYYSAEHGATNEVAHYLDLAERAASDAEQEWRRARVLRRIAQVWVLLGQTEKAEAFSASAAIAEPDAAKLQDIEFFLDGEFEEFSARLDEQISTGGIDAVKSALYIYADLNGRFYKNDSRRTLIEEKIKSGWDKLPLFERIDLLETLSGICLKHEDTENAIRLVKDAGEILDGVEWPAEYHVQLLAKLAKLQIRCGEADTATGRLESAMAVYAEKKNTISDIYRAETLTPVAEAYCTMNAMPKALEIYALAVEESVANPNSRPQAEDLSAICLSMATHAAEPGEALWVRIRSIMNGLGNPW